MTDSKVFSPPQSLHAEQNVLGAILRDSSAYAEIESILTAKDFFHRKHQLIYRAIQGLTKEQTITDLTTVSQKLLTGNELDNAGGRVYLVDLAESVVSAVGVIDHAKIVRDKSRLREMIRTCDEAVRSCYNAERSIEEIVSDISTVSVGLLREDANRGFIRLGEATTNVAMTVDDYIKGKRRGVPTGFESLDRLLAGFQQGEFIIIAARPQNGKTALTYNMAANQAKAGHRIAFFSVEMSRSEFALRALCTGARVDSIKWKSGKLIDQQTDAITIQNNKISGWPFWINDCPGIEIHSLITQATQLHRKEKLDIIYIDYLQLLKTAERFRERRHQMDYISGALKGMARRLDIPVVAVSQFSRDIEKRRNKEPQLSDLKESGALEQDADVVILPQREKLIATKAAQRESKMATLYVKKVRNGPTGNVDLYFEERFTLFEDPMLRQSDDGITPVEGQEPLPF